MGGKRSRQDSVSSAEGSASASSSALVKIIQLDRTADAPAIMKCSLPPHPPLSFASFDEYEAHYQKTHLHRCSECRKNFPDDHFLHLHIAEMHDPISAAKRERGERTYACLVPDCERLCSTPQKRRLHCIDKHQFPRNYDFFIVKDGIDRRSSMLRPSHRRRSSTMNSTTSASGRRRAESSASAVGEHGMQIVKDEDQMRDSEEEEIEAPRSPLKLRGRGGFGREMGRGNPSARSSAPTTQATTSDPVDSLASRMSALHFVPHSVRTARDRGRGKNVVQSEP